MNKVFKYFFLSINILFLIFSCSGKNSHQAGSGESASELAVKPRNCQIVSPSDQSKFKLGDKIKIALKIKKKGISVDSVLFYAEGTKIGKGDNSGLSMNWNSENSPLGQVTIRVVAYLKGAGQEENDVTVVLLSNVAPIQYSYTVVKTYPHDASAYTQGLIYDNGFLFEGTGLNGQSTLRKENLKTSDILKEISLSSEYFGEGITLFNNKIYQITWKSQVGFVYDKESFKLLNKVYFQNAEGWGLTNNGKQIILSDGTEKLFFLHPDNFAEDHHISVYDNKGMIDKLNELEYIKGDIYANVYGSDYIVIVDPATGKVKGKIDLKGLLKKEDYTDNTDVLNGIAYDPKTERLFVTGKNWPKLFEIKIHPKK
ncbi:MAG: glutaminyl-peptide cyclotransferase [Bacteroidota bacterium]|nr:glutaminyl-peptide cyclotransferase [Bacteroidota bacterium]